jgi:Phosphatidylinositol 3- and 4-kinase
MVLVLAALYTYARYNNHDPCGPVFVPPEAGEAAAAEQGEVAAALSPTSLDDSHDSSNSAADQQQSSSAPPQDISRRTHRRRSSLHQRLQRRVSDTLQSARHQTNTLLHTTVGRCHSASYYTNTPDEQEEEEATSASASASSRGRRAQSSSSPAASSSSSPAAASASRLYASIPLQGSSRSYSLLATDHHQTMMEAAMPTSTSNTTTTGGGSGSSCSHNRAVPVEDVSLNMFPPSVREEWINAVFGKDYCTSSHNNSSPLQQTKQKKQQQHQGMGHAGIASYTSYTTTISNPIPQQPHARSSPSSTPVASTTTTTTTTTTIANSTNKVGITISRLPLGAHVRRVAPSSEAALLGIQVGDVLVSINGWNVLCEPSRPLLERLWQYEGVLFLLSTISSISNRSSEIAECKNDSRAARWQHASQPSGTGSGAARTAAVSSSNSGSTVVAAAAVDSIGNTISSSNNNNNSPPCNTTTTTTAATTTTTMMTDPVAMTFSRAGQLYQVLFLSCGSWGMAWAPCGNFPLVKRSYGLAAAAGVQRGSILAAVDSVNGSCNNGSSSSSSFRDLDHYGMAMKLSNDFQSACSSSDSGGENPSLHLTLCFPPRAARPPRSGGGGGDTVHSASHSPSPPQPTRVSSSDGTASNGTTSLTRKQRAPQPNRVVKMDDGVEIKFHSLEFALGGICSAVVAPGRRGQYTSSRSPTRGGGGGGGSSSNTDNSHRLSDLAEQVAAGAVESPFVKEITIYLSSSASSTSSSSSPLQLGLYSPCPTLSGKALLDAWNPLESLLYCCAFFKAGYQEDAVQDFLNDCHHQAPGAASSSSSNSSRSSSRAPIVALRTLMNTPHAASMASAFLLQFISVICFPHSPETAATATSSAVAEMEEKKSDDVLVQGEQSESNNNKSENSIAKELTSMLLKLSRRDEGFCQRLYFLSRSYISSIETTKRVSTTTLATTTPATTKSSGSSSTKHLLALLNCLELLRFAEKQLHHSNDSSNNNKVPIQNPVSVSHADDLVVATTRTSSNTAIMETSPIPSAVPASPASSASMEESAPAAVSKMKKTSVLHFLRKKKASTKKPGPGPSSKLHPSNTASKMNMVSPLGDGVGQVVPLTMSNTPVAVVTPSVSQHQQQQQYGMSSIMSDDNVSLSQSPSVMYENMSDFLGQLDQVCSTIERSLQRSFRQKIADWAMQPWSASKDSALASVTSDMRQSLKQANNSSNGEGGSHRMKLLVNPVESSELLSSVDADECYILPSAHFPILLTFNVSERRSCDYSPAGEERIYRTTVKLRGLSNSRDGAQKLKSAGSSSYTVHAAVAGKILASDESLSIDNTASRHAWGSGNNGTLVFDTRSSWGAPQTLSLRLSSSSPTANPTGSAVTVEDATFGWVDLSQLWKDCSYTKSGGRKSGKCQVSMLSLEARDEMIDEHGEASDQQHDEQQQQQATRTELELEVSTEFVNFGDSSNGDFARKRMLLYKHDDDLRQEDFAVQFIRTCDNILKASGLDMKLLTFNCIPVGTRRGFVEWVPGSVPLSEVCQPFLDSILESSDTKTTPATDADGRSSPSMFAKAGLTKYESLFRLGGSLQSESLRRLAGAATAAAFERGGPGSSSSFANNPVQDYLRSVAYAQDAPYLIRREVMDTYVKSCAGYSVITYILGVGDRHLDNLLLHQSGSFFHCDYSFLLGSDPKKYLPMRITEDMVNGMGGKLSDNYAKFLSLTSAAFLALRRPEIVRILLSLVRLLECSNLPDMSENQSMDQAVLGMRDRLRLDLREDEAVAFMEHLIEDSLNSKLWLAVDAMHSLGKKF